MCFQTVMLYTVIQHAHIYMHNTDTTMSLTDVFWLPSFSEAMENRLS